jgi:hypothetical protein
MSVAYESRYEVDVAGELPETVDRAALRRMEAVAYLLDDGLPVPGTDRRVGLDPLVGLLPVAGDTATAVVSLALVVQAALLGVGRRTLARMLLNVGVDAVAGSVPVVGDLFDAVWKANRRNVKLALRDLSTTAEPTPA